MCWNEVVSMNTFLFGLFAVSLITYNYHYTTYKIYNFNIYFTAFLLAVVFVQFFEAIIWRNLKNDYINRMATIGLIVCLFLEPIFAMLSTTTSTNVKPIFIVCYLFICVVAMFYVRKGGPISKVSQNGHLDWCTFNEKDNIFGGIWTMFFLFPVLYDSILIYKVFALLTVIVTYYNWKTDHSFGSMWCYIANACIGLILGYLLFYLPFVQNSKRG